MTSTFIASMKSIAKCNACQLLMYYRINPNSCCNDYVNLKRIFHIVNVCTMLSAKWAVFERSFAQADILSRPFIEWNSESAAFTIWQILHSSSHLFNLHNQNKLRKRAQASNIMRIQTERHMYNRMCAKNCDQLLLFFL